MIAILARMWLAFLLTSAAPLPPSTCSGETTAKGPHFEIRAHFDSQPAADMALKAAEAAVPFAESIYGRLEEDLKEPLAIHLYATAAEYLAVESQLTHGRFARNGSFTSDATHAAYVALQPELSPAALAITGLPLQTRLFVAHEATHLICHRLWSNAGSQPFWFSEGAALWAAEEAVEAQKWWPSRMEYALTSSNAQSVRRLFDSSAPPDVLALIHGLPGGLTFDERQAVSGAMFRYLKGPAQRDVLAKIVEAARGAGDGSDVQGAIARATSLVLQSDESKDSFQAGFEKSVLDLGPAWDEVHRALWPVGDVWAQAAFANTNAIAWRTQPAGCEHYAIAGEFAILPGASHQLNLLLARSQKSFVQVSFTAGFGLDVFHFDAARGNEGAWKKLATVEVESIVEEQYVPFRVVVEGNTVSVYLGDKPVCAPAVEGHPMQGAWGLGALAGSAGLWRKLAFRRL